jgi:hypothetical protein
MSIAPPADFLMRRMGFAGLGTALLALAGWIAFRNLSLPTNDGWIFWVPSTSWLVTMGLLCWWSAVAGDRMKSRTRIRSSWRAGFLLGGVGLMAGFLGPLILSPKASLGPLLGILLTGPLGFVLGALVGGIRQPKPATS